MQTEEQFSPQQQRKGRVVLVLMLIFFVVPLLVVFLTVSYTHLDVYKRQYHGYYGGYILLVAKNDWPYVQRKTR